MNRPGKVQGALRRGATLGLLGLASLILAGCLATPNYRPVGFVTPKDPPPLPLRKPVPPADLAAWQAPPLGNAAPIEISAVAVESVEVEQLAPQNVSQQKPAPPQVQQAPVQQVPVQQVGVQPAALQQAPAAVGADGRYIVAKGDSLFGISRRFGLPIRAVIDANGLQPPYALTLGQSLTIPQAQVHVVVPGDTIFSIARHYDVDRSELVRLNGLAAPYSIPVGQQLILPTPGSAVAAPQATTVAFTPAEQPAKTLDPAPAPAPEVAATPAPPTARSPAAVRAALAKLPPRAGSTFSWPLQGPVLSSYGAKSGGEHNDGINIAAPRGTPVRAAENGVVAYAGEELKGFGRLLLIKHADGWVTAYAHNEELLVGAGDTVKRGQTVARVGSSGNVQRPQLHFEVRRGTRALDPEKQLAPRTASLTQ